jgi:hypothetical protein
MGVDIYGLMDAERTIRIGGSSHRVGVIGRLWKVTETSLLDSRIETVDALEDAQRTRQIPTPRVVVVDGHAEFGERGDIRASLVLGWPAGKLKTQDYDWDHLPELGWAVETSGGPPVLYERDGDRLTRMSEARAVEKGILDPDGTLAEQHVPVIAECRTVASLGETHYTADCVFQDGRTARVLGETESGTLPPAGWFVGRAVDDAANYRFPDQLASGR